MLIDSCEIIVTITKRAIRTRTPTVMIASFVYERIPIGSWNCGS